MATRTQEVEAKGGQSRHRSLGLSDVDTHAQGGAKESAGFARVQGLKRLQIADCRLQIFRAICNLQS